MTGRLRLAALLGAAGLVGSALTGCEPAARRAADHNLAKAADQKVCTKGAKPLAKPYAKGFPNAFPFPPKTVVYHVEDRGGDGTIVTAVSADPFRSVLRFLNHEAVSAGFKITSGETEEHDAEANWTAPGSLGRWAIRESGSCPAQTVIQVLAAPAG